ncbi:putative RNA-dependent RNA polymerase [Phoma matteucciicola ourmia-like virus 1]|uniref:Putative RNA-dependent RNA polymerase n=1 Tax=Phoma matteucciicola ourmia-like virus 1 TaxID=2718722 RepID=A0A6G9EME3_9VIRU|nr:putative RNA-dependent RNA polymerase [Phoma matteucciicola ourmia-like virus 1]QIP68359.1 putative RNA-dependent RNA polymerase [Phoma matteucciicola ourmia-like virus 1]
MKMTINPYAVLFNLEGDSLHSVPPVEGPCGATQGSNSPQDSRCNGRVVPSVLALGQQGIPCFGRGRKVACNAAGRTKYQHRGCFPGGATVQNYPSAPYWIDPDPCPAIASATARRRRRMETRREKSGEPARNVKSPASCARGGELRRKAQKIVRLLEVEQSLKAEKPLPSDFVCGSLRAKVRSMYGAELTQVQLLSIKTSAMAESQPCPYCENLQLEGKMENWIKARYRSEEVDVEHLARFAKAFAENVPAGWNRRKGNFPYVPNGAATLDNKRSEGGNWNTAGFSSECRASHVFTKGKWRLVTMYSSHNVAVLTPLHNSLYSYLKGRSWLLVGNPTSERLDHMQKGCAGQEWLSFDYEAATDNIKTAYVQRAVEILIDKGEGLEDDEIRCLRVLGELSLGDGVTESGQPMGSPMSFPVLCLINKTVVDLALTELLCRGEISFKEWTSHRCLINGDDLLTKSTSSGSLPEAIFRQGSAVGLRANWDKTLADPEYGEINSTVFKNCAWQKKTNVSALWMAAEVTDVLGYALESTTTKRGFLTVVKNNVTRLARQKIKTSVSLPWELRESILACRKLKKALCSTPASKPPKETNLFPVVVKPEGYDLSRQEEVEATLERVRAVRERELFRGLPAERRKNAKLRKRMPVDEPKDGSFRKKKGLLAILKPKRPREEESTLLIFALRWERKRKEELLAAEGDVVSHTIVSDLSRIGAFVDEIRTFKEQRKCQRGPIAQRPPGCLSSRDDGYVSLADV